MISFLISALLAASPHEHLRPHDVAAVTLYQHCDYQGWAAPLRGGEYTSELLKDVASYRSKGTSSIRVSPGYKATLYARNKFKGKSLVVTHHNPCLVSEGFNDRMVSIKIERLK